MWKPPSALFSIVQGGDVRDVARAPLDSAAHLARVDDEVLRTKRVPERRGPDVVGVGVAVGVLAEILRFVTPRIEVRRRRRVEADTEAALGGDATS